MSFPLLPSMIADGVTDLSPEFLRQKGIRLLMLDFDNTIVPYTTDIPTEPMTAWLKEMLASDIGICVVSNSRKSRVTVFCREMGIPCVTHAGKPCTRGIRQCMERFHQQPCHCALAGDQIFTDTLGANLAGVYSILVKAIDNHNFWLKARHVAEKPFIYLAKKRRTDP